MTIGIMSAMREEIQSLVAELGAADQAIHSGMRTYHRGRLWGQPVVLVFSRWGKVAAAATAAHLIARFGVEEVIFSGVAGAADPAVHVGDVVIADKLYQHDMDARPFFPRHEIPLLGVTAFETEPQRRQAAVAAAHQFLTEGLPALLSSIQLAQFHIARPKVVEGDVASGDKFFANKEELAELKRRLPWVACVEMEGAAVARVCHECGVPFQVIRTVSDSANDAAPIDFPKFVERVASVYSRGILRHLLHRSF